MNAGTYKVHITVKGKDSKDNFIWVKRNHEVTTNKAYTEEEFKDHLLAAINNDTQLTSYAHDLEIVGIRHLD